MSKTAMMAIMDTNVVFRLLAIQLPIPFVPRILRIGTRDAPRAQRYYRTLPTNADCVSMNCTECGKPMEHGFVSLIAGGYRIEMDWRSIDSPRMQKFYEKVEVPVPEVLLMNPVLREMKIDGYLCRECGFLGLKLNSKLNKVSASIAAGFP
jgi:hypothetical protein